ncbi:hypothetical protein MWMV17_MWMV17_01386 [Acinetobacter calcoaceticus]|uniref:Uncharacterized protein n=1 Tax=Acinetobacter calcoaceticus DSM 30006 = CIP 81.8 TaxID=981331 RepID=A0ABN0KBX4_ACICA|nr:hypothetical protein [Acinetobacter calcoaceticus]ENW01783.1 hypothetical protein F936_00135 [Acinetobacter calcoaceticus DSM 30006 = CIP 81.8]CAI3127260.1 hypothetical protein MWMV17_MWMV17_01386 [Acinetobacter calcoaceticus]SUU65439.1 putative signal peptide-containing protein [Acinetobacter calcoaceticus]
MKKMSLLIVCSLAVLTACAPAKNSSAQLADSPIQAVLLDQPDLLNDASNLDISQQMNAADDPSNAQVTILQTDPSEDAITKVRTEYLLKRDEQVWKIVNKKQSYQCTKGQETPDFQVNPCP